MILNFYRIIAGEQFSIHKTIFEVFVGDNINEGVRENQIIQVLINLLLRRVLRKPRRALYRIMEE